jgi:hypothetical protein
VVLERHFGRVVLRTSQSEVYSLDLYEINDAHEAGLVCRGYYVHPRLIGRSNPVPMRVELSTDGAAFSALYEMFGGGTLEEEGPWEPNAPYSGTFLLGGYLRDEGPVFNAQVSAPLRLADRTVWTGSLASWEGRVTGRFDFILEQHGTIEPALLFLVVLFFIVFYDRDSRGQAEECYRQALRLCGDAGNIKSHGTTSGVTGATFRRDSGCQTECFERWHPSDEAGVGTPEDHEDGT